MRGKRALLVLSVAFVLLGCIGGLPFNQPTPTPVPTATPEITPTQAPPTPVRTPTAAPTHTPTPIPTATPTLTPTPTAAPSQTPTPTATPVPTAAPSPTSALTPTPTPACSDSDGGRDEWVRGKVVGNLRGTWGEWWDDCDASGAALEYYCSENETVEFVKISCPTGCNNGMCRGTRPSGTPIPSLCGNGVCGSGEDWTNCCKDCGCPENYYCRDYSPGCLPWLDIH